MLCSLACCLHRSFHAAYLAFFSATFAVFAVPSLVSPLRDDLGLTDQNLTDGVIASVAGTVAARLVMGTGEAVAGRGTVPAPSA